MRPPIRRKLIKIPTDRQHFKVEIVAPCAGVTRMPMRAIEDLWWNDKGDTWIVVHLGTGAVLANSIRTRAMAIEMIEEAEAAHPRGLTHMIFDDVGSDLLWRYMNPVNGEIDAFTLWLRAFDKALFRIRNADKEKRKKK